MKNRKRILAAAVALVMLLQCLFTLPLTAAEPVFDGSGTVIAVLTDGFNGIGDARFKAAGGFTGALTKDVLRDKLPSLDGKGIYINARIPYAYDYAGSDTNLSAENSGGMTASDIIISSAPASQLVLMKIYNDKGEISYVSVCAAMRDAFRLGAAIILLDIDCFSGTDDGSELDKDVIALIAEADKLGIAVVSAAGNNGMTGTQSVYQSNYGIKYPPAPRPDTGTVSAPSTIASVISVGSRESKTYTASCISYGKSGKTTFNDTTDRYDIAGYKSFTACFDGKTLGYVPVGGTGTREDCAAADDLDGRIALIKRGDLTFTEKVNNAADLGAVGVIVYDNIENNINDVSMSLDGAHIPAILVPYESGVAMLAETDRRLHIKDGESARFETLHGGIVSSFSSRGVTPSLQIKPELIAEGGSRDITLFGDKTQASVGNDTLYSAAEITADFAALAGYYRANGIEYDTASLKLAIMNAASPVKDIFGVEYSPRAQGAGAVSDLASVLSADSLLYGADGAGKISLGDGLSSSFALKFTAKNTSGEKMTYKLSATVTSDDYAYYAVDDSGLGVRTDDKASADPTFPAFITGNARAFGLASVTTGDVQKSKGNINAYSDSYEPASITLEAGESRTVTLLCAIDGKTAKEYASVFPNGYFVDGYITMTSGSGVVSSIPYTGFCGSFGRLTAIDASSYDKNSYYGATYFYSTVPDNGLNSEIPLGYNILTEDTLCGKELVAFSPNGDLFADNLSFAFTLLRNVTGVSFTVSDSKGASLFTLYPKDNLKKSFADINAVSKYRVAIWDGKAEDNSFFTYPDGKYMMTVRAVPTLGAAQTYKMPFVIDTTAPALNSFEIFTDKDGGRFLRGEISDGHYIQSARLYNTDKDNTFESVQVFDSPISEKSCLFDITSVKSNFVYIEITDYAYNVGTYRIDLGNK